MQGMTKDQQEQRGALIDEVLTLSDALESAITDLNSAQQEAFEKVQEKAGDLNEAIGRANELMADIHSEAEAYYDDRSERWQESEKGEAYSDWKDEFDQTIEEVDVAEPDEIDFYGTDAEDILNSLPEEFES